MRLQKKCSGVIVEVPDDTLYDAAVYREIKTTKRVKKNDNKD